MSSSSSASSAFSIWLLGLSVFALFSSGWAVIRDDPTVLVTLFIRNKAHTLPYFLKYFEDLDYPKQRMALWIQSEGNQDQTLEILNKWIPSIEKSYHKVHYELLPSDKQGDQIQTKWTPERFRRVINLKEEALLKGRDMWADFVWYLDSDVLLLNNRTLKNLVVTNYPVVAPMLDSLSLYSNYWCGMGVDYYYRRTDEYVPIREREKKGCFRVMLVHSAFLIDLRQAESLKLTFKPENIKGYQGPHDDIIVLAISAFWSDVPVYVCNQEKFAYIMVPLEDEQTIENDHRQLSNVKQDASVDFPPMEAHPLLTDYAIFPAKDKLGFDEVFMINLERRPERRRRMEWSFRELGIDHKLVVAVDGKLLNDSYIESLGVRMLPNFADPYHNRAMTMGEIGCFLSHMGIWKEIVDRQLEKSLIFEDDIRFEPYFREKLTNLMDEAERLALDWDLIYVGRKRLQHQNETWVPGSETIAVVGYSYWTLSYMLTLRGAEKLLNGEPLSRLVPVDEYLPIMFDRHPEKQWAEAFPARNLKAYSAAPLLVYPTQYTGEPGYISDTEASEIVPEAVRNQLPTSDALTVKGSKETLGPEDAVKVQLPNAPADAATIEAADLTTSNVRTEL